MFIWLMIKLPRTVNFAIIIILLFATLGNMQTSRSAGNDSKLNEEVTSTDSQSTNVDDDSKSKKFEEDSQSTNVDDDESNSNEDSQSTNVDDDDESKSKEDTSKVDNQLSSPNRVPTADAGTDEVVNEGQQIVLNSKNSKDPEGNKLSFEWKQVSPKSPIAVIKDGNANSVSFQTPIIDADTLFLFELVVNDGNGGEDKDMVRVLVKDIQSSSEVNEPQKNLNNNDTNPFSATTEQPITESTCGSDCIPENKPPTAVATISPMDTIEQKQPVALIGTGSFDPDGDTIDKYEWKQLGGDLQVNIVHEDQAIADFIAPEIPLFYQGDGVISFSLTVTDSHGAVSFPPAIVSIRVTKCSPEDDKKADEVNQRVTEIINYAKSHDLPEAAKRYEYWRQGSGLPLPLDVGWLRSSKSIPLAEDANHVRFQTNPDNEGSGLSIYSRASQLKDGERVTFTDKWDKKITFVAEFSKLSHKDIDFSVTVGATQLSSTGTFTIIRIGDTYTVSGKVNHKILDKFDFNPGDVFPLPPSLGLSITADDLNLLQKCRNAMPFDQNASWDEVLVAQGKLKQLQHSKGVWEWTVSP